jgi:hypothetical protein
MIYTSNPIIKHKAGLLNLAKELGNVSKACRIMGVSRDSFYRYQELMDNGGLDTLINQDRVSAQLTRKVLHDVIDVYVPREQIVQGSTGLTFGEFRKNIPEVKIRINVIGPAGHHQTV